jgi:hypothetical protein
MVEEKMPSQEKFENSISNNDLNKLRETKLRDNNLKEAFKEIIICLLFVTLTMTVSYQMLDYRSLQYRQNLMNLFGAGNINSAFKNVKNIQFILITIQKYQNKFLILKKVQKITDIWDWAANVLTPNLLVKNWKSSQIINQSFLINDLSSILLGNPIVKQKRVSESIKIIKIY